MKEMKKPDRNPDKVSGFISHLRLDFEFRQKSRQSVGIQTVLNQKQRIPTRIIGHQNQKLPATDSDSLGTPASRWLRNHNRALNLPLNRIQRNNPKHVGRTGCPSSEPGYHPGLRFIEPGYRPHLTHRSPERIVRSQFDVGRTGCPSSEPGYHPGLRLLRIE